MLPCIQNKSLSVKVKPFGATLTSIRSEKTGREFLWQGDPKIWNGQSPILFPIIGRLLADTCLIDGKSYSIIRHGLARHRAFALAEQTDTSLTFLQESDAETRKSYPYDYRLFVRFALSDNRLTVTHTVENPNDRDMYFSIGAHPAFNCALGDRLIFEVPEKLDSLRIDTDSLLTDRRDRILTDSRTLVLTAHLFDRDALIFEGVQSRFVTLQRKDGVQIRFHFGDAPYLAVWAKPAAPFVCLEPWYGVNDGYAPVSDFSKKRGIVKLSAGETFAFSWDATFSEG